MQSTNWKLRLENPVCRSDVLKNTAAWEIFDPYDLDYTLTRAFFGSQPWAD
jgi:hypothetical protein